MLVGRATSGAFRVNSVSAGARDLPAVATRSDGTFVVAWEDGRDEDSVVTRRYDGSGDPIDGEVKVRWARGDRLLARRI